MADDDAASLGQAVAVVAVGSFSMLLVVGAGFWAMEAYGTGRLARCWRWLRVMALGGVTTLERKLSYNCAMCQYSLDAREVVRTLSCNHVFHCRETDKCRNVIDRWLVQESMICPICRNSPLPVLPWKARPPLSPAPAPSGSAEQPMPVSEEPSRRLEDPLLQSSQ
ncbi:hypothetical protein SEVIR_7G155500v4 [Setaria viridis]|uniref:RING-type domain-containing protein n=3 Tax=Setaria TaxID=4554 RepID=A0A368RVT5_SETIT|nr:E3 ubiquitin-protein ligase RNF149-like [Setaria viridis]RCV34269.1 hypothetical protein SETIT_7G147300v2 [Setaria italica]TKW05120.1 hypothetical protein SEVIR_7G155500v2 [Setaria viridis]